MTDAMKTPAVATWGGSKVSAPRPLRSGGGATQGFFPERTEILSARREPWLETVAGASASLTARTGGEGADGLPVGLRAVSGEASARGVGSYRASGNFSEREDRAVDRASPDLPDPDYLVGSRAIGKALGLPRAATMLLIERAAVHTIIIGDMRCARRSEIDRYLADQINTDAWENEGGPPGPEPVAQTWTEASWRRRRRGGERP